MTVVLARAGRHADRVFDVVRGGAGPEHASQVVASSWQRCLNDYRLHPDRPRQVPVMLDEALKERMSRMADVIDCARYEMTTLFQQMGDDESAVLLTDTDGVIMHMVSSAEFSAEVEPLGLRVGAVWSENEAGTNGMGTCLAAASPVTVRREDHFFTQFTGLTCSAVPIHDPNGEMVAVLDVSSRSTAAQQHLLVLLGMTARMIENRLIDSRFGDAHPVHFHSRPEFVYTLHEGRLAVSALGKVLAANRGALLQLGVASMDEIRGRRLESLFQISLTEMLERSAHSSYHPVVTYRSDAANRFFVVARQPVKQSGRVAPPLAPVPEAGGAITRPTARRAATARIEPAPAPTAPDGPTFADPTLVQQLALARRVIAKQTPVLLRGETGCGKEVFAKAVHEASPHAAGPLVAINCASLPENLIESELFGYRAGAFTGAQRTGRRGKILQADGGTLFLDEIGDMPLALQARLLRVLEEREVSPLGSEEVHAVNFQLISASHRDLAKLVETGQFREDLFYRLAGVEVDLPALRARSDRGQIIDQILAAEAGAQAQLSAAARERLMAHPWPGNVRQLRNALRAAAALADGPLIDLAHLPAALRQVQEATAAPAAAPVMPSVSAVSRPAGLNPIQANERQVLLEMLTQHRWNVSNVAKALGVSRNTLYRKLHKLHIQVSNPDRAAEASAP